MALEQSAELIRGHPNAGEGVAHGSLRYVAARMNWHADRATIGVFHEMVTALNARDRESGALLGTSEHATTNQATLSVKVSSSGMPTSSSRSSRLSRRSAIAASCVGPYPNAATPGRSVAEPHQTPSSSCSMT